MASAGDSVFLTFPKFQLLNSLKLTAEQPMGCQVVYTVDTESIDRSLYVDKLFSCLRYNPQFFFANSPCNSDKRHEISLVSDPNFLSEAPGRCKLNSPSFS